VSQDCVFQHFLVKVSCFYNISKIVAMKSICFCIVAAVFLSSSILGSTQSYKENYLLYTSMLSSDELKVDDELTEVNISVNLRTAVREVDSRFVSITLDSSLVDRHWAHLDFRYDVSCL